MVYGVCYMAYFTWCMVYGISCMLHGIFHMVYGIWYMVIKPYFVQMNLHSVDDVADILTYQDSHSTGDRLAAHLLAYNFYMAMRVALFNM